jgi:hypothetical protein
MADRPYGQPAPSEHEKAAAEALGQEVAALLLPALEERNRRLSEMCDQLDTVTAELAKASASLARMAEAVAGHGAASQGRPAAPARPRRSQAAPALNCGRDSWQNVPSAEAPGPRTVGRAL